MATSLTLQAATAATFDTGWRQAPGNAWTDSSLVLTLTGAGAVLLTLQSRDDDSTNTVYRQEVSWSASGSQTITLPTPFFGQLRLTGEIKAAGGTIAVAISGDFGPSPVSGPNGEVILRTIANAARSKTQTQMQAKGNTAYYRISGNVNDVAAAASNELFMIVVAAEDAFEGFQVVFPPVVGGATVTPSIYAVKPVGSLAEAEATTDISGWSQPTKPVQPNVADITAVRANLHGVVSASHWLRSVARSDGGTKPLLAIVIGYGSGSARTQIKYTQTAGQLAAWRSGSGNGGRILAGNYKTGYTIAWNSGTNISNFPILGVNFFYRKPVINILRVGDSRADGAGASIYTRDGCLVGQIDNIVAAHGGGVIVGDMNLSMPQQNNDTTFPGVTQYLTSSGISPEAALVQLYSINSVATSEASTISAMSSTYQEYRSALIRKLLAGGSRPIVYNTSPCTTAAKDLTLSDYLRVENNARFSGIVDLDFAAHASGSTVNGQVQPAAGAMASDGIHESDAELAWQGTQLLEKMRP